MSRLKPYNHEFDTLAKLNEIIENLRERLNHEKSQGNNQIPIELWQKEKEYLRPINPDLKRYFESVQLRKVSKDAMIRFQNHQYSVSPNYIGKEVEIKPLDDKKIEILFNGVAIRHNKITNYQFNYDPRDKRAILKSDLMKDKTDEEIN